jgi:hypothetical protein
MKKVLILILIIFILTSIITISFTLQASQNFQNFEDDNGDDNDDSVLPLAGTTLCSEVNNLRNKIFIWAQLFHNSIWIPTIWIKSIIG